jgi:ribosomal protein L35
MIRFRVTGSGFTVQKAGQVHGSQFTVGKK